MSSVRRDYNIVQLDLPRRTEFLGWRISGKPKLAGSNRVLGVVRMVKAVIAALCVLIAVGACATLPDASFLAERRARQAALIEDAKGLLSPQRSAALLDNLKRRAGHLDILDRQLALEQEIAGTPLVAGNRVTLLQDGPATYRAMFEAIERARDHINIESYIIEDGAVGQQFADLLLARQQRGVQVNLIYDSVGAFGTPRSFFEPLMQAGARVLEFNPVNPLSVKKGWAPNHRDHRKLLVVDGRIAFTGGINISSSYSSGSSIKKRDDESASSGWRDTDIRIEGPAVAEFQKLFLQTWDKQRGQPLPRRHYFPAPKPVGKEIVRAIGSSPDDRASTWYLTMLAAIMHAAKQIYLTNAYFVPDPQLLAALSDAARRGVDVRLILPANSDSALAFYAGRAHYSDLLESGVRIYERQGATLHAKAAVIDGIWSCVGSSNLDWRSALDNDEIDAVILGSEFAQQMQAAFRNDLAASAEINPGDWNKRALALRLKELGARLWERLL